MPVVAAPMVSVMRRGPGAALLLLLLASAAA